MRVVERDPDPFGRDRPEFSALLALGDRRGQRPERLRVVVAVDELFQDRLSSLRPEQVETLCDAYGVDGFVTTETSL